MKLLVPGDLHLHWREISVSSGYPEQSLKILDMLKSASSEFDMMILPGDIAHTNSNVPAEFLDILCGKLEEIKDNLRLQKIGITYGNHRFIGSKNVGYRGRRKFSIEEFLANRGICDDSPIIDFGDFEIHQVHFSPNKDVYNDYEVKENKRTIGIFHDDFIEFHNDTDWHFNEGIRNFLCKYNLSILAHIHQDIGKLDVEDMNCYVMGSTGRPSINAFNRRDSAKWLDIDTDTLEVKTIDVPLVPFNQLFPRREQILERKADQDFKDFIESAKELVKSDIDLETIIKNQDADENVKLIMLEVLKEAQSI